MRPATAAKVIAAARALDYPKRLPEVHRGLLRIDVIMVRPETTFFQRLSRAFERINGALDPSARIHRTFMEESDPEAIAARVASTEMWRAGLILAVPDHPATLAEGASTEVRRELEDSAFVLFHLAPDRRLLAASGIGLGSAVAKDIRLAEMLIARRAAPDPAGINLKKLL